MKNITLSVEEEVLVTVRRYAAAQDTTVNALVRQFLTGIAGREQRAARARQRITELSAASNGRLGTASWTRDQLHER